MSVTQWPVIGLEAAEANPDFFGLITIPGWVKTELQDHFLLYDQNTDGGFGYTYPSPSNVPRTGAGLACQAWVGLPETEADVQNAITFLDSSWSWTGCDGNIGNFYSMYAVNKGMRGFDPDVTFIGPHDWYTEYANWLIGNQAFDGGWSDNCWFASSRDLTTAAGVLILVKEVIQPPPVAVADAFPKEAPPGATITFDHSGSFHLDPSRTLVDFRWDFNNDSVWDFTTTDINQKPTTVYDDNIGCGEEVVHYVTLEVEDDDGNTDQDTESVTIKINLFNHPPVAIGDPTPSNPNYEVSQGAVVCLDASSSYDPDTATPIKCDPNAPDDYITSWEWDLDNDGTYDASGETYCYDTPDTWAVGTTHTIQLKVTDEGTWAGPDGGGPKSGETTVTILVVPNQPPDCSTAEPTLDIIWPPNHKFVAVNVIGVTDPDGDSVSITIDSIYQDEPVDTFGDGTFTPDGQGVDTNTAQVRAERSATKKVPGDGRVYHISFTADDGMGGSCSGEVLVGVPHDKGKGKVPIDGGAMYDSTALAP